MNGNFTSEDKLFLKRLAEQMERSMAHYTKICTDFLPPDKQILAQTLLERSQGDYLFCGGYASAERRRLVLIPPYTESHCQLAEIKLIRFRGRMDYVKASHRDYLGAILSLGVKREKFGDLLLTEDGCAIYAVDEMADYLAGCALRVRNVPMSVQILQVEDWTPPPPEIKVLETLVSSMRLDTLCAHGFGLSRTKALEAINAGRVQVNHNEVTNGDCLLKPGDTLSFRGKGKLRIAEVTGETKKGKLKVNLHKYI